MINKDSITDLFFDLDHTLWDFETNSQHTFASILAPYAFPFTIEKFMEAYTPINHAFWKLYRENKISTLELRLSRLEKTFETLGAPQLQLSFNRFPMAISINYRRTPICLKGQLNYSTT